MKFVSVVTSILQFVAFAHAQATGDITLGPKVHVSKERADRTHWETVIAIDPENPKNMLACWIDGEQLPSNRERQGFSVVYSSDDGGKSWRRTLEFIGPDGDIVVDPHCVFGPSGVAYATAMLTGAPVYRSVDAGRSWVKANELGIVGYDREYLTVDNTQSRFRGRVYFHAKRGADVIASEGRAYGIGMWQSSDRGNRFFGPATLASLPNLARNGGDWYVPASSNGPVSLPGLGMSNGTVQSDGTFYAVVHQVVDERNRENRIVSIKSDVALDNRRFSSSAVVSDKWLRNRSTACRPLPSIAADTSSGEYKDRLYVVWSGDDGYGKDNVLVSSSFNNGATWSKPRAIQGKMSGNANATSCTLAIDVNNKGVVGVTWYRMVERPNSRISIVHETWFAASVDGGETFLPPMKLSSDDIKPKWFRIGETIGLDAGPDGKFHALWIENRTGNPQVYYAPITVTNSKTGASAKISSLCKDKDLSDKIYNEKLRPQIFAREVLDWVEIEKQHVTKHGSCGREAVWKARPEYYFHAKDWGNYQKSLSQYVRTYGMDGLAPTTLNNYAWAIFKNVGDKAALEEASQWSLRSVQKLEGNPEPIDTYANILHRLGRTKEAIGWMKKAAAIAKTEGDRKRFQVTIDKMKRGEPTWPR